MGLQKIKQRDRRLRSNFDEIIKNKYSLFITFTSLPISHFSLKLRCMETILES